MPTRSNVHVVLALITACGSGALSPSDSTTGTQPTSGGSLPAWYSAFGGTGVSVKVEGNFVVITTTDVPDHKSPYFGAGSAQYEAYNGTNRSFQLNPNVIRAQQMSFRIPLSPTRLS